MWLDTTATEGSKVDLLAWLANAVLALSLLAFFATFVHLLFAVDRRKPTRAALYLQTYRAGDS